MRWTRSTGATRSGVRLWNALSRRIPALFTTIARLPNSSMACWMMRSPPSAVATLSRLATATPPAARISSTTCSAGFDSPAPGSPPTSLTTTRAPRRASSRAWLRPSPRPAPVTIATSPSNSSRAVVMATPDHREPAADAQDLARDPGGQRRGKEEHCIGYVLRLAHPSHRVGLGQLLGTARCLDERRSAGCRGGARRDAVYRHALTTDLLGKAFGQADQPCLGSGVHAHKTFTGASRIGDGVDDPASSLEDVGQGCARHVDRANQSDADHPFHLGGGGFLELLDDPGRRVVHEDRDGADLRANQRHPGFDRGRIADVHPDRECLPGAAVDGAGHAVRGILGEIRDSDRGPSPCQLGGDRLSDAAASTGDQRHLAGKINHDAHHPTSVRPVVPGEVRLPLLSERGRALFGLVGLKKDVETVFG